MPDDIGSASSAPAAQTGKRFAAFISYSHRDEEFGDWLHKRLESYQVPSALVGRESSVGQIGKRLGKVFRDRADLSAAHDLGREIREGLEQSDALIVLCSPRSCGSKYVQEEIRIFKQLGRGQRIFAAIIDGEPHAAGRPGYTAADECFPPALIFALNPDGSLSSQLEPTEPIAADFRDGKDGRENGSLKIIAGLLDVGLDELVQREKQAERARRLRANAIAAAMAVLALGAVGAGAFAWLKQNEALRNFQIAEQQRGIADEQRDIANSEAENARIQELAAIASAAEASAERDNARAALGRMFAEKSANALDAGDSAAAARYALAGRLISEDSLPENRLALAAVLSQTQGAERIPMPGDSFGVPWAIVEGNSVIYRGRAGLRRQNFDAARTSISFAPPVTPETPLQGYQGDDNVLGLGGARLLTYGRYDRGMRLWNARTGALIRDWREPEQSFGAERVSPDDRYVAVRSFSSDEDVATRLIRLEDGHELRLPGNLPGHESVGFVFSADSSVLASIGFGGSVLIFEVATGAQRPPIQIENFDPPPTEQGARGNQQLFTHSAAFSPDGSRLVIVASHGGDRGRLDIWDTARGGAPLRSMELSTYDPFVTFVPNGLLLIHHRGDRRAQLLDSHTLQPIRSTTLHEEGGALREDDFSSDLSYWAGLDDEGIVIKSLESGDIVGRFPSAEATSFYFLPSGDQLLVDLDGESIIIIDLQGRVLQQYRAPVGDAFFRSYATDRVVVGMVPGAFWIWPDRNAGRRMTAEPDRLRLGHWERFAGDGALSVRINLYDRNRSGTGSSNWESYMAVIDREGRLRSILGADSRAMRSFPARFDQNFRPPPDIDELTFDRFNNERMGILRNGVRFSTDNSLVAATDGRTGGVYEAESGRNVFRLAPIGNFENRLYTSLEFDRSGRTLAVMSSERIQFLDWRTQRLIGEWPVGSDLGRFSPDGRLLAILTLNSVSLLDWRARRISVAVRVAGMRFDAVEFSPDGHYLATTTRESSEARTTRMQIWQVSDGVKVAEFELPEGHLFSEPWFASGNDRIFIQRSTYDDGITEWSWDLSRYMQPMSQLAAAACASLLEPREGSRTFSDDEIAAESLLRTVWLDAGRSRDVCVGVPGLPRLLPARN